MIGLEPISKLLLMEEEKHVGLTAKFTEVKEIFDLVLDDGGTIEDPIGYLQLYGFTEAESIWYWHLYRTEREGGQVLGNQALLEEIKASIDTLGSNSPYTWPLSFHAGAYEYANINLLKPSSGLTDLTYDRNGDIWVENSKGVLEKITTDFPAVHWRNGQLLGVSSFVGYTNIIPNSDEFLGSIQSGTATYSNNQAIAPNNKNTATLIQNASNLTWAGNNIYSFYSVSSSTTYNFSLYLKSAGIATTAKIGIRDQTSGLISSTTVNITPDKWVRADVSRTTGGSTTSLAILVGGADGDFYAWGRQVTASDSSLPYSSTTPRTNLLVRSEEFNNTAWSFGSTYITADQATDPNGFLTADLFDEGTTTNVHSIFDQLNISLNTQYTFSCHIKDITTRYVRIIINDITSVVNWVAVQIDLETNTITSGAGSASTFSNVNQGFIVEENGWIRLWITAQTSGGSSIYTMISPSDGSSVSSGDSRGRESFTATNRQFLLWGAQFELGSTPTEYERTTDGTVGIVSATLIQSASLPVEIQNATEYTVLWEGWVDYNVTGTSQFILSLNSGTSSNSISFSINASSNDFRFAVFSGGVAQALKDTSGVLTGQLVKLVIRVKTNDVAYCYNGSVIDTDTSVTVPSGINTIDLMKNEGDIAQFNGYTKRFAVIPVGLSNEIIETL